MTGHQAWLNRQSSEFHRGYYAGFAGEKPERNASEEWMRGYEQALRDETITENARYV